MFYCFVVFCVCVNSVTYGYLVNVMVDGHTLQLNVQQTYINNETFGPISRVRRLSFPPLGSDDSDLKIDSISDLTDLTYIEMNNLRLSNMPIIQNTPQLKVIIASNNSLTTVSNKWFFSLNINTINLSFNHIEQVNNASFTVDKLILDNNELTQVSPAWFQKPNNLVYLSLRNNKFTNLPNNFLSKFINLRQLDLSNNQIVSVGTGALSLASSKYRIYMANNSIAELQPGIFEDMSTIDILDISYNRLSFLSDALLAKFKTNGANRVSYLRIEGNPWQCSCRRKLELWMAKYHIREKRCGETDTPICIHALAFKKKCVEEQEDELYSTFAKQINLSAVKIFDECIYPSEVSIHPNCTDNIYFAPCELIVQAKYCTNKYYGRFCCRSCTQAGQLPSYLTTSP